MYDYAIMNGKLYINGHWETHNLYISEGKIALISDDFLDAAHVTDADGLEVLPGIIDPHVHFELDLGKYKSVDDFYHGTVAAAYGGVTSIVDFLDPAGNADELQKAFDKRMALAKNSVVDFRLHACIKNPSGDLEEFVKKMKSLDMHTLKLFTTYSDSGRRTYEKDIIKLLELSEKYKFLLLAHIENDELIRLDKDFTYQDLPISRSSEAERSEALKLAQLVRDHGGKLYMVHLSDGHTLEALIENYGDILNRRFFVESCPQYFTFTNDDLQREDGYLYTFAPPLRGFVSRKLLFVNQKHIDTIGTDHCAFNVADKKGKMLFEMPLGIGGIEHSFTIMRHHLGDAVINKMTVNIARIQGLEGKGEIKVGNDADLVFFKPAPRSLILDQHGRADYSLYIGQPSHGQVISTMVRGQFVIENRVYQGGRGQWIKGRDIE
ncbi:MAG: amidohydrolase family protein [Bacilli bacterium]|nr:amidohydrolase family protein [Bacilli bacterium]